MVSSQSPDLAAWAAVLRAHAAVVPLLDRELQDATGMPLAWYDVLLELMNAPDRRLTMSELGDRVTLSRTRVSRVVDELERAGLVARQAHPTDRRSTYATVTGTGSRQFRAAVPVYLRAVNEHVLSCLRPSELTAIAAGLQRVADAARRDRS